MSTSTYNAILRINCRVTPIEYSVHLPDFAVGTQRIPEAWREKWLRGTVFKHLPCQILGDRVLIAEGLSNNDPCLVCIDSIGRVEEVLALPSDDS